MMQTESGNINKKRNSIKNTNNEEINPIREVT